MQWAKKQTGFTIVELLIVIVVIAILAAITIVAYNGIQARAAETTIRSDLRNLISKVEAYKAQHPSNAYPDNNDAVLDTLGLAATKSQYDTTSNNFLYCGSNSTSAAAFAVIAKNGKTYVMATNRAFGEYTANPITNYAAVCVDLVGINVPRYGYVASPVTWRWIGG
jgi:prepilin-type N-terminal cleavage/methylation domain-containing protein